MNSSRLVRCMISELSLSGNYDLKNQVNCCVLNIYDDNLLKKHISKRFAFSEAQELKSDPYMHELFSIEKRLIIENEQGILDEYQFVESKLSASQNSSNPIYCDCYQNSGCEARLYFLGEYYIPILLKLSDHPFFYSTLDASEKSLQWILRMTGDPFALDRKISEERQNSGNATLRKATCFNMQLSPGHYIEDELPFVYKASKYLSSDSDLAVYYTRGFGFEIPEHLRCRSVGYSSRAEVIEQFNLSPNWFIPNITRNIGYEDIPINFSDIAQRSPYNISNEDPRIIKFAFGVRLDGRNGYRFEFGPGELRNLCRLLEEEYFEKHNKRIMLHPILDFSIKDYDESLVNLDLLGRETSLLLKFNKSIGCELQSTLNLDLPAKLRMLGETAFGIYPHGSGGSPYVAFMNDRPLFAHNFDATPLTDGYFDRMFHVLKNDKVIFNKSNLFSLEQFTRVEENSWTLELSIDLAKFILSKVSASV